MAVMLGLGVYDDLRQTGWLPKFAFQIVAACIVIHEGLVITKITNPFGPTLELPAAFSLTFTIVWLVGITNAVNLSDGLDGLATGIVMIVCGVTFANSLHLMQARPEQYQFFVFPAITSVAVLGAAAAFLRFNFYPARIFLGDTGSLFLGFLIACTAVRSSQISTTTVALVVPMIALGLPILDTVLAFLRRTARRRNPFQADLEHIHHKMMESGLSHPETVLVLYAFCLLLGVAALVLALKKNQYAGIVLFVLTVITLAGFKKFGVLDVTRLWGMRGKSDDKSKRRARSQPKR
jgi:UDP-GlcNAc:undecaprenyl-phosphate GlcNAc-1-phosphate transferase